MAMWSARMTRLWVPGALITVETDMCFLEVPQRESVPRREALAFGPAQNLLVEVREWYLIMISRNLYNS